ncbi:MAG: holo-ACP synthase [Deltaproteobacteria bacterium]|nr:holo-ACP synthase [Deltaproteobacteria bacterium]
MGLRGVGIDALEVERFARSLKRWGVRLTSRVFTDGELRYCMDKKNPATHLAARFAAKVSFFKALGRSLPYKNVEVGRDKSGRPFIKAAGIDSDNIKRIDSSITHDAGLAIAHTIIED